MLEVNKIYNMDCLEGLKLLDDNSVDAIITDPPYNLNFMGKTWDNKGIAYNVDMWKLCLRVLKHGGYLLSFGGTRTYHRMTCGIEDAGFEIRDCIMWIYGSGFPKSLNIGKQIDKIQGNERKIIGKLSDLNPRYATPRNPKGVEGYGSIIKSDSDLPLTKGNSEWEGWGTALKPAVEPIVVARKPLSEKNVALNVLKWGTGGINIDESRIGNEQIEQGREGRQIANSINYYDGLKSTEKTFMSGRFPANIILDEESAKMLDEQSGISISEGGTNPVGGNYKLSENRTQQPYFNFGDKGGASRFFYVAKASKSERNNGLEDTDIIEKFRRRDNGQPYGMNTNKIRPDGSERKPIPPQKNNHPTVKPIKLMEYLIKLITRENAIVLDPFGGSGTTAIACKKLNRNFILIEKEQDYVKIAEARLKKYLEQQNLLEVVI